MYTFDHEATEQTPSLTDYRYIGRVPYNYVSFNNEIWRIIGIFDVEDGEGNLDRRIKLIRNESIGNLQWSSSNINEWVDSAMQEYLNETYTLDDNSQEMITGAKWYLGGRANTSVNGEGFYASERSRNVKSTDRSKNWIGIVGLMYPSDYLYAYSLGVDDKCFSTPGSCNAGVPDSGWLFLSWKLQWTLTPNSASTNYAYYIFQTGGVFTDPVSCSYVTRPTLYLKPNVKIKSGDGTIDNPYEFEL